MAWSSTSSNALLKRVSLLRLGDRVWTKVFVGRREGAATRRRISFFFFLRRRYLLPESIFAHHMNIRRDSLLTRLDLNLFLLPSKQRSRSEG